MPLPDFRPDGWLPSGHHPTTWTEIVDRFNGPSGSRRRIITERLLWLKEGLHECGVQGFLVLDGSYISSKEDPNDFDVLLVAEPEVDMMKISQPSLAELLDPVLAEKRGYSILYCQTNSKFLSELVTLWDRAKDGITEKGVAEVSL